MEALKTVSGQYMHAINAKNSTFLIGGLTFRISFGRSASLNFLDSERIASCTVPVTCTDTAYPLQLLPIAELVAHVINPLPIVTRL